MIKILAIGNSFSQDATRYLYDIAKNDGVALKVVNLYIGGCSLRTHFINALEDKANYSIEFNGATTGFYTSIKGALISDEWDVITLQQSSSKSFNFDTYQPYLDFLADYVRKYSPKAKIYIHQTWPYEEGSAKLLALGFEKKCQMFSGLKEAYFQAKDAIGAQAIIPSGDLMVKLAENGIEKVYRDTYHASRGVARYALALLWYKLLLGRDVSQNSFADFDEPVSDSDAETVRRIVGSLELL